MTEGSIVTDCWGELFYITPGLGLELGFDGPQGFPLPFHNELSVATFLGTLSSFDLSLLSQRFSSSALGRDKDIQQAIIRGRLHVFPMDAPIALVSAVHNNGRPNQSASAQSNFGAVNTKQLSAYGSASNDLECVNRTQEVIRSDIRKLLRHIVEQERIESRQIEKGYKTKSALGKSEAHIQRVRKGLHEATGSFLTWMKDVYDVVSITQRVLRILTAAQTASHVETENRYELFQKLLNEAEKKEIVEVLGFDPSLVTVEKITEVYSLAKLVYDDHATRLIIAHFVENYIKAQHSLEWSETSGGASFEIILTAFMTVVTGGVGAIASLGAQARKLSQLKKLGELFSELAELLKKVPKAKKRTLRDQKEGEDRERRERERGQKPPPEKPKKDEETEKSNDDTMQEKSVVPKTRIITEKFGTNEAKWTIDETGKPISVEAKLDSTYSTSRSSVETKLQGSVGGEARKNEDDGGHMIGHRFMSDQGDKNLFPQNSNLNRGAYKKMENEWAAWTEEGFEVKLKVELHPPGSERPTDIISQYDVIDPKTGDVVFDREHIFSNTQGESFERVNKADMKSFRI